MKNKLPFFSRRNFIKRSTAAAILTPATLTSSYQAVAQAEKKPTRYAPELSVPYWINGKGEETDAFTLSQHENKWVVLKCFQNWCPGCHATGLPALKKMVKTFGTEHEKITFAAIQTTFEGHYINNKSALRPTQLKYETAIPYGHDAGDPELERNDPGHYPNTMRDFGTRGTPWFIIIAPNRQIVFSHFHLDVDTVIEYFQQQFA